MCSTAIVVGNNTIIKYNNRAGAIPSHFNTVAAEFKFKSSTYKMFIIYTRTLATDIQMTLVASKWAVKKKYLV